MSKHKDEVEKSPRSEEGEPIVRERDNKLLIVLASSPTQTAAELKSPQKDAITIEKLLDLGADINATDENGNTALHIAVKYSQTETVKLLLKRGANFEAVNGAGVTPLQMAAFTPNSSIIFQLLLENGASLYAVDRDGNTVLHTAAASDNISVIEKIAAENPSFYKIKNRSGNTPLHVAAYFDHERTINRLLDLGADPNIKNKYGQTPLDIAIQWGGDTAKQVLEAKTEPTHDQWSPDGGYQTLKRSPTRIYRRLPPNSNMVLSDILKRYEEGDREPTLLHQAIAWSTDTLPIYKSVNLLNEYISRSKEPEGGQEREKAFTDCLNYLGLESLPTKIQVQEKIKKVNSTASRINLFLYGSILESGGGLEQPLTLAHIASSAKKIHAELDKKIREDVAKLNSYQQSLDITQDFLEATKKNNALEIVQAALPSAIETLKSALSLDVDVWSDVPLPAEGINLSVHNLLNLAHLNELKPFIEPVLCEFAEPETLTQLLDNGNFDINAKDKFGNTPLHVAAYFGYSHIVKLLLERGADPDLENNEEKTPFAVAKEQNHTQVFEILQQGFNLNSLEQLEVLQFPSTTRVDTTSLRNIEEHLLAQRSYPQAFVDWVHVHPIWSGIFAVFGSVLLFVPTISIIVAAAFYDSSKKPIKNFINEFAVAAINGELDTHANRPLNITVENLTTLTNKEVSDAAREQIIKTERDQKTAIREPNDQDKIEEQVNSKPVFHSDKLKQNPYLPAKLSKAEEEEEELAEKRDNLNKL